MLASYTTWALSLYLLSSHIGNAQAQVATVTLPYAVRVDYQFPLVRAALCLASGDLETRSAETWLM